MLKDTVTGVVAALAASPATFVMAVMCFGLLGFVFYEGAAFNAQRFEMTKLILEHQKDTQDILARCVIPEILDLKKDLQR